MQTWIRDASWEKEECKSTATTTLGIRHESSIQRYCTPTFHNDVIRKTNKFREELKAKDAINRIHEKERLLKEKKMQIKFDKFALETTRGIVEEQAQGPTRTTIRKCRYERKKAMYEAKHPILWNGRYPKSRDIGDLYPFLPNKVERGPHGSDLKKSTRGPQPYLKREKRRGTRRIDQGLKLERSTKLSEELLPISEPQVTSSVGRVKKTAEPIPARQRSTTVPIASSYLKEVSSQSFASTASGRREA